MFTVEQAAWVDKQLSSLADKIKNETGREVIVSINYAMQSLELIMDDIIKHVSNVLNVPVIYMLSDSRKLPHVYSRYICLFIIRKYYHKDNPHTLGLIFRRDRTTIIHSFETIDDLINSENEMFLSMLQKADSSFKNIL